MDIFSFVIRSVDRLRVVRCALKNTDFQNPIFLYKQNYNIVCSTIKCPIESLKRWRQASYILHLMSYEGKS